MITFQVQPDGSSENYVTLTCITAVRQLTILAGIARGKDLHSRILAYCNCAVAGMDIALPQSRTFQILGLGKEIVGSD